MNNGLKNALKKATPALALLLLPALATAAGLEDGTTEVNKIKVWGYGFLGALSFVYMLYYVVMAMGEKKQWVDVLMALGKVAAAGGILLAGEWAWSIWGS